MMYDLPPETRPQPSARLLDQWVRDAQELTGGSGHWPQKILTGLMMSAMIMMAPMMMSRPVTT